MIKQRFILNHCWIVLLSIQLVKLIKTKALNSEQCSQVWRFIAKSAKLGLSLATEICWHRQRNLNLFVAKWLKSAIWRNFREKEPILHKFGYFSWKWAFLWLKYWRFFREILQTCCEFGDFTPYFAVAILAIKFLEIGEISPKWPGNTDSEVSRLDYLDKMSSQRSQMDEKLWKDKYLK